MRLTLLLALAIATVGGVRANQTSASLDVGVGVLTLTFDSSRIAAEAVRRLIKFSPYNSEAVPLSITVCNSEDPEYLPCGSRDIHDPNFSANAEVNLRKNRGRVQRIEQIAHPKEFDPVFSYLKAFVTFTTWLEETKYEFTKSWDTSVLRRNYDSLDPGELCPAVLDEIEAAGSEEAKWKLAWHDWHNCLLQAFRKWNGDYPEAAWEQFLAAYGIKETFFSTVE